jgi:hypothetical protein
VPELQRWEMLDLSAPMTPERIIVYISAALRRRISAGTDLETAPLSPLRALGAIGGIDG